MVTIRKLRRSMDITQRDLAEKVGVERSTISKWETGTSVPRHKILIALSKVFKCSIDDLIDRSQEEMKNDNRS